MTPPSHDIILNIIPINWQLEICNSNVITTIWISEYKCSIAPSRVTNSQIYLLLRRFLQEICRKTITVTKGGWRGVGGVVGTGMKASQPVRKQKTKRCSSLLPSGKFPSNQSLPQQIEKHCFYALQLIVYFLLYDLFLLIAYWWLMSHVTQLHQTLNFVTTLYMVHASIPLFLDR